MGENQTIGEYAAECKEAMLALSPDTWSEHEKNKIDKYIGKIIDVYYKKNGGNIEAANAEFEKYIEDVKILAEKSKLIAERKAEMAKAGLTVDDNKAATKGSINGIHDLAERVATTRGGELFGYSELLGMVGARGLADKLKGLANMDFMIARVSPEHEGIVFTGMAKGISTVGDVLEKIGVPVDTTQMAELKERIANSEALERFQATVQNIAQNIPDSIKNNESLQIALDKVRGVLSLGDNNITGESPKAKTPSKQLSRA